jgi:hypothetical protein
MSYHINGGASSSQVWSQAAWLDFNMAQTWSAYQDIYPMIQGDYQKQPAQPCGLGEGAYEDGPQYPTKPINALIIRKQACWSYFAGGYHTYGNGNVWHFDTCKAELTQPWKEALHSPGAESLKHVKGFLAAINWPNFVPDQSLFAEGQSGGDKLNVAMRSSNNDALAVYLSSGAPVKLHLDKLAASASLTAKWVNPATGQELTVALPRNPPNSFTPPAGWSDAFLHVATGKARQP